MCRGAEKQTEVYEFHLGVWPDWSPAHGSAFLTLEDTILLSQNLAGMKASVAEHAR